MRILSNGEQGQKSAFFGFLSPVRLPFRHTGNCESYAVTFAKVLDGRKQPVRGLWVRNVMSGIDYMTIAKWVGHRDGGILIGKVRLGEFTGGYTAMKFVDGLLGQILPPGDVNRSQPALPPPSPGDTGSYANLFHPFGETNKPRQVDLDVFFQKNSNSRVASLHSSPGLKLYMIHQIALKPASVFALLSAAEIR